MRSDSLFDASTLPATRSEIARFTRSANTGAFDKHAFTRISCLALMAALPRERLDQKSCRFALVDRMKDSFGSVFVTNIALQCFGVSKAGYYKWKHTKVI